MFDKRKIKNDVKGKNADSLYKSRQIRAMMLQEFGVIPESILLHNKSDRALDSMIENEGRDYVSASFRNCKALVNLHEEEMTIFGISGRNCRGKKGALSRFPQNIGRLITKLYCPEKGLVYDPFAGHNSRMQLVFETGRSYIGVDISKNFMNANIEIRNRLMSKYNTAFSANDATIKLILGTSSKVDCADNIADFTITSPPYWDLEYYGDEQEQLGKNKTYKSFLNCLQEHIIENHRILKTGAFCCWFVNDFRKNGKFYSYHSDVIRLFKKAGFEHFNTYIVDLGSSFGQAFAQEILKTKILPKRHEYCLVFIK